MDDQSSSPLRTGGMHAHKGNIPSLPQTKQCAMCPARFTRTTHLNRHLRSHTNERLHRCSICKIAEFTRSDLLTRHKRTCGHINRSRRKSCEACAESKIKCTLTYPCAKCTARGRACVFVNDPETSKTKTRRVRRGAEAEVDARLENADAVPLRLDDMLALADVETRSPSPVPPALSESSSSSESTGSSASPSTSERGDVEGDADVEGDMGGETDCARFGGECDFGVALPPFSDDRPAEWYGGAYDCDYECNYECSASLDYSADGGVEAGMYDFVPNMDIGMEMEMRMEQSAPPFDPQLFASFTSLSNALFERRAPRLLAGPDADADADAGEGTAGSLTLLPAVQDPPPAASTALNFDLGLFAGSGGGGGEGAYAAYARVSLTMPQPAVTLARVDALEMQYARDPAQVRETYLHLFLTRFLAHVPLIHAPTLALADTPPVLARIFHACGALFVRTPDAAAFVAATLASASADIARTFCEVDERDADADGDATLHMHLILALVLLQTICLLQRADGGLAPPMAQQHRMLISLIRRSNLIERVAAWTAPEWSDPASLEAAWMDWARFATIKRALLLAYLHDCSHCMYNGAAPALAPAELGAVPLPCDDALWRARGAAEWLAAAAATAPVGAAEHICGVRMPRALAALAAPVPQAEVRLPPFALFLLIHTVLRNIAVAQADGGAGGGADFACGMQGVLDGWLQLWFAAAAPPAGGEPPFVCNSLPFYWLAQVALWRHTTSKVPEPLLEVSMGQMDAADGAHGAKCIGGAGGALFML